MIFLDICCLIDFLVLCVNATLSTRFPFEFLEVDLELGA